MGLFAIKTEQEVFTSSGWELPLSGPQAHIWQHQRGCTGLWAAHLQQCVPFEK